MSSSFVGNAAVPRRTFLRGTGAALALPLLDAMRPAVARAGVAAPPQRLIAVQTNQGILPQFFFPTGAGRDYEASPYLEVLKDHRDVLTAFGGVSHPDVDGGHHAEHCFLTAAPHPGRSGFRNTVSVDQFAAEHVGHHTRFPSLVLGVDTDRSISVTPAGVMIPAEDKPSRGFAKLFVQGSKAETQAQIARLADGQSVLDSVADRTKVLERRVGPADRAKLDQYLTGVREFERRLHVGQAWEAKPKPRVDVAPPKDVTDPGALVERTRAMFDLAALAIRTDSTRLITVYVYQNVKRVNLDGVTEGTHQLTHHGNRPEKLDQLRRVEEAQFRELARLLDGLRAAAEEGGTLLDHTAVLYGTCLGNANAHSNTNLPVLVAGGGFRHGQYVRFDRGRDYPLANLFVSLLQRLGVEADRFASGTGTMRELEVA